MVEDETVGHLMNSRTRFSVMTISAPVIAFAVVGGFLGKVLAREDTYPQLRIFGDVVDLISSNYVEEANIDRVMRGAMKGLADQTLNDANFATLDRLEKYANSRERGLLDRPREGGTGADHLLAAQKNLMSVGAKPIVEMKRLPQGAAFVSPALLDVTEVKDLPPIVEGRRQMPKED